MAAKVALKAAPEEKKRILKTLENSISLYLDEKLKRGEIRRELYDQARLNAMKNITSWLNDEYINKNAPGLIQGLFEAVRQERWEDIIYAFASDISFGTAGIRGQACFTEADVKKFMKGGLDAPIIRGPNTINDIVLLLKSAGLAKYACENGMKSIVIGYDSRIMGGNFAELIARLFLSYGLKVYLFDEACPYPELTYTVPTIGADLGVLISASHNDKRYNGYKISSKTGAQIDVEQRNMILNNYIKKMGTADIRLADFRGSGNRLVFLGGSERLPGRDYLGKDIIDMHSKHIGHVKNFIVDRNMLSQWVGKINAGYCAFYGAGYKAVPRILKELGVRNLEMVNEMNRLDGTFPCFHLYQQPDPGDVVAEEIAVEQFKKEHSEKAFEGLDVLISTDPDADRVGFVVRVPDSQKDVYRQISQHSRGLEKILREMIPDYEKRKDYGWYLLTADEAFLLLMWYRFQRMKDLNHGVLPDAEKSFIVINHTTTEALIRLAQKYGVGAVTAWVGIMFMAKCVEKVWNGEVLDPAKDCNYVHYTTDMDAKRSINLGVMEQSSGFTIMGGRPLPGKSLGENGHTRDKDGILAATVFTELVAYAKSKGKNLIELLDDIYLDPDIGFFANYYEPSPYWGQFEGPTGLSKKIAILKAADKLYEDFKSGKKLVFAGRDVVSAERYATGKYDELHGWKGFPDEGIRFFFGKDGLSHLTIRPSGTSHCLRFHIQLRADVTKENLLEKKAETYENAKDIVADVRKLCGA